MGVGRCALAHGDGGQAVALLSFSLAASGLYSAVSRIGKEISMVGIPSSHADSRSTSNSSVSIA